MMNQATQNIRNYGTKSVSYTHLDVYKRQGYNSSPGVMKDSKRDVLTGSLDFQYRLKKVLLKNSSTLDKMCIRDRSNIFLFVTELI